MSTPLPFWPAWWVHLSESQALWLAPIAGCPGQWTADELVEVAAILWGASAGDVRAFLEKALQEGVLVKTSAPAKKKGPEEEEAEPEEADREEEPEEEEGLREGLTLVPAAEAAFRWFPDAVAEAERWRAAASRAPTAYTMEDPLPSPTPARRAAEDPRARGLPPKRSVERYTGPRTGDNVKILTDADARRIFRKELRAFKRAYPRMPSCRLVLRDRHYLPAAEVTSRDLAWFDPEAHEVALLRAALHLGVGHVRGIIRHELGHAADLAIDLPGAERRADALAEAATGRPVRYAGPDMIQHSSRGRKRRPRSLPE